MSYDFMPVMYFTDAGKLALSWATRASSGIWTRAVSGNGYGNPDPALNLPYKFDPDSSGENWDFNPLLAAPKIRGFFVLDATQTNPGTGLGLPRDSAPAWGDPIQIEARIYNYSTLAGVTNVPVRFDIQEYNSASETVIPSSRRVLGSVIADYTDEPDTPNGPVISTTIPPLGVGRAVYTMDWNTQTIPVPPAGSTTDYAVFVVIDPDNQLGITENHGWRRVNVVVTPSTCCGDNVGATLVLKVNDDHDRLIGTVSVYSQGDVGKDVECLVAAFSDSPGECAAQIVPNAPGDGLSGVQIATQYGIIATANPAPVGTIVPTHMVLAVKGPNGAFPASTNFDPTLAFTAPVNGTSALHIIPSVGNSQGQNASVTATNLEYGQNNEGYGLLSVAAPTPTPGSQTAAAEPEGVHIDRFMKTDSLGAIDLGGHFDTRLVTARVGTRVRTRVCAHASAVESGSARIAVYLGDPENGGIGLADKQLRGIDGDRGSCAWFSWTPREKGTFSMHAVLTEGIDDALPTNNRTSLEVRVLDRES